ncbi:TPR domain-containing protein [Teratosphaeria destructans]|uniref:TPR domain-containing protein n=1 Tax=Teratosphaeria destructans TaxID=418781 RepID=A0A9W7SIM5_9PEZI|nr:TPR domain-containing protein [Teratosphaeria destructans]
MGGFGLPGSMMAAATGGAGGGADEAKLMMELMEQERERLRAAKTRKGQKAQNKRSRADLAEEFSSMRRQAGGFAMEVRRTYINFAYPPSIRTVTDLTPITISELRLETHHTGKVLFLKTFGTPTRITAVQNAVEDEFGDVDRIAVYNTDPLASPDVILPHGAIFAVKEPYYKGTADGGVQIRVDHPSDIVPLQPQDAAVPPALAPRLFELDKPATFFKTEGNAAYAEKHYETAIVAYTNALEACGESEALLRYDIFRNRAMVNLCLKRHERTLDDALAAIIPDGSEAGEKLKELNNKAYFRAGRAAYELGRFSDAESYYLKMSELCPGDADAAKELKRTKLRLQEASAGVYDFAAMSNSVSKKRPHLDHASFTEKVEVRDAGNSGRGLFAKTSIKAGEVILCEKAFSAAFGNEKQSSIYILMNLNTNQISAGKHAMLLFNVVKKMLHSPAEATRFFDLHDGGYDPKLAVADIDGVVAVDTFRAQAIIEQNAFGCPDVRSTKKDESEASGRSRELEESSGVWIMASYMNHACVGNSIRSFIGDMMIIRATKDIVAGQEILQPYRLPGIEHSKVQRDLQEHWGFKCQCAICVAEDSGTAAQRGQRAALNKEVMQLLGEHKARAKSKPTALAVFKGERLMTRLRAAYGTPAFNDVPKVNLAGLGMWLMRARSDPQPKSVITLASGILRDMGFGVAEHGDSVDFDHTHCHVDSIAIDAAMHAAEAHWVLGQMGKSASYVRFARKLYITALGEICGFDERYHK